MMKDFKLSIAQGHFHCCDLIPTIIHPYGILLLAQARPKMPSSPPPPLNFLGDEGGW